MLGPKMGHKQSLLEWLKYLKDGDNGEEEAEHQQGWAKFSGTNVKEVVKSLLHLT